MKRRWKIILAPVALAGICAFLLLSTANRAQRELEAARRSLRQQGFKLDLTEFNFSTSPELRTRAAMLATTTMAELRNRDRPSRPRVLTDVPPLMGASAHCPRNAAFRRQLWSKRCCCRLKAAFRSVGNLKFGGSARMHPPLMTPAGIDCALVFWKLPKLRSYRSPDLWAELRESLDADRQRLDAARQAATSGPIRFEPIGSGPGALLPYLADLKGLETTFGMAACLGLHDGQKDAAWTNLLAATCLVTGYTPEPLEISHLVRFACATIACDITWNALQSHDWSEAQLANLQHRWKSADFWSGLPEAVACNRANMAAGFKAERAEPPGGGMTFKDLIRSPRYAWPAIRDYWRMLQYRHEGIYEDEKAGLPKFCATAPTKRHFPRCLGLIR